MFKELKTQLGKLNVVQISREGKILLINYWNGDGLEHFFLANTPIKNLVEPKILNFTLIDFYYKSNTKTPRNMYLFRIAWILST